MTLADDTGVSIKASIFGEEALRTDLVVGAIIAVKEAKVSDYGGKSLTMWPGTLIKVEPREEKRYKDIKQWYKNQTAGGKSVKLQQLTTGGGGINMDAIPFILVEEMD